VARGEKVDSDGSSLFQLILRHPSFSLEFVDRFAKNNAINTFLTSDSLQENMLDGCE